MAGSEKSALSWELFAEKEIYEQASGRLGRRADALRRAASQLGMKTFRPWRADEKTAALSAWLVLVAASDRRA